MNRTNPFPYDRDLWIIRLGSIFTDQVIVITRGIFENRRPRGFIEMPKGASVGVRDKGLSGHGIGWTAVAHNGGQTDLFNVTVEDPNCPPQDV